MTQTFADLGLNAAILQALSDEGYTTPTPIQAQAIPIVRAGRDLLGIAQTGTGKTAAFALPLIDRLASNRKPRPRKGCRVLVLSPTRELASQIAESFATYGRHQKVSVAVVFGGVGARPQVKAMAPGVDVLVATPGRLIDHLEEGNIELGATEYFVLDEADQMLDLGFVKPIRQIARCLPRARQNLFFSATMPREIGALAEDLLRDPARVSVAPVATTAERVAQRVIFVEGTKKGALLAELAADQAVERMLVFARTKRGADRIAKRLILEGTEAAAIHGNKSQRQRELALEAFRTNDIKVLVATDIAARGIDVDGVSHVVNYDLPEVPEAYVHRIGRTARAGASGIAISFCDGSERDLLKAIERLTRQEIPAEDRRRDHGLLPDASPERERARGGGGRGRSERGAAPRQGERSQGERSQGANPGRRPSDGRSAEPRRSDARSGEARSADRSARPASADARPQQPRRDGAPSRGAAGGERRNEHRGQAQGAAGDRSSGDRRGGSPAGGNGAGRDGDGRSPAAARTRRPNRRRHAEHAG